jgi:hypothetical protein
MDAFIETHNQKIASWIYGHTHTPNSTTIHGVPMLCNPIGYPNENPWRENIISPGLFEIIGLTSEKFVPI